MVLMKIIHQVLQSSYHLCNWAHPDTLQKVTWVLWLLLQQLVSLIFSLP